MTLFRIFTGLIAIAAGTIAGQTPPPAFEVASVKPAAPSAAARSRSSMRYTNGRVELTNVSLKNVLARAYDIRPSQINGPSWMDSEYYDVVAKIPDGTPKERISVMFQTLLAERFKMAVHKETKEESVYVLVVGKNGPKLTKSEGDRSGMKMSNGKIEFVCTTMASFVFSLANLLGRPVLDMTQIEGKYDIVLEVATDELPGMRRMGGGVPPAAVAGTDGPGGRGPAPADAPSASLFSAVQQLGLKLESRKAPVEHLIVDSAEKVPTEN